MLSRSGVQQGDPLGPLGFCVTTFPLAAALKSNLNVWYLDDDTVGGELDTVLADLELVIGAQTGYGLELNKTKSEAYIFNGSPEEIAHVKTKLKLILPGIRFVENDELCLLESPLSLDAVPLEEKRSCADRLPSNPS